MQKVLSRYEMRRKIKNALKIILNHFGLYIVCKLVKLWNQFEFIPFVTIHEPIWI